MRHALTASLLHRQGNAEVRHDGLPIVQEDVFGLDIAMNHALAVRVVQRTRHFTRNPHRLRDRQLSLPLQSGPQCLARHQRHHVVQQPRRLSSPVSRLLSFRPRIPRIQQRQYMRVLQTCGGADLAQEPFAAKRRAQVGMQHLDRDIALVLEVVREIHRRHAAGAKFALDAVPVRERHTEALDRHVRTHDRIRWRIA